jgi:hypothetical protein
LVLEVRGGGRWAAEVEVEAGDGEIVEMWPMEVTTDSSRLW